MVSTCVRCDAAYWSASASRPRPTSVERKKRERRKERLHANALRHLEASLNRLNLSYTLLVSRGVPRSQIGDSTRLIACHAGHASNSKKTSGQNVLCCLVFTLVTLFVPPRSLPLAPSGLSPLSSASRMARMPILLYVRLTVQDSCVGALCALVCNSGWRPQDLQYAIPPPLLCLP